MHPGKVIHEQEFSRNLVAGKVHATERIKFRFRKGGSGF